MKTMHGARRRASAKRLRTREAPTPTNISWKLEPEADRNGTPASVATARASSVLPVPGSPVSSTPRGARPPEPPEALRVLQELDRLGERLLHLVHAGDVGEAHLVGVAPACAP